jgi:hypothetical protein
VKVITNQLYDGCYEQRVYPFAEPDADMRKIISDGYVRVLFTRGEAPRIIANIGLGEMTVEAAEQFQEALTEAIWLVERSKHIEEPAVYE